MPEIRLVPIQEFQRVSAAGIDYYRKLELIADMCRLNALNMVKRAGSGHLGSSLSSLDIVVALYYSVMNTAKLGLEHPDRDIYFSSKGHDVPGFYAVLYSLGLLPKEKFINLRRFGGTCGHPDVGTPGVEANSGSLGMGISKAKGMAIAKKMSGHGGGVFVMTGDGELQEGQIWESLQTVAHQKVNNIQVIVDCNKIQTDRPVKEVINLGDLQRKFEDFGWHAARGDGHDFAQLEKIFREFENVTDRPKALIADTVKGKGISFMEGPQALKDGGGLYRWHSGAPDDDAFEAAHAEIAERINRKLGEAGLEPLTNELIETRGRRTTRLKDTAEKVVDAYGEALAKLGEKRPDIVVLDADLAADCGLRFFEAKFPDRFIENGIAEQDMVSTAGGLALQGFLPIVNSFGVFLASRANEQIYTNSTEGTKIIYVCHYAGLIPAGPGQSHQSLRDISLLGAMPNLVAIEPANATETALALEWCVNEAKENCMLRLVISPSPRTIALPANYKFEPGQGCVLRNGNGAAIFAYGPVMLNEVLLAGELLAEKGFALKVVNMPWLNRVDVAWFEAVTGDCSNIFVLDDHSPYGGLGDNLLNASLSSVKLRARKFHKFAVEGFPACGTPAEALAYHRLDGENLAERILDVVKADKE
ncbi:MAG: 1-deoxy-D-xylulose-5-phosphate synthase [Dehalococcoidia bacterium]|nr:MAG: 1-deoxy-D-xylulose-5-phosphate synthase [Dehalococcoidia bacterium]